MMNAAQDYFYFEFPSPFDVYMLMRQSVCPDTYGVAEGFSLGWLGTIFPRLLKQLAISITMLSRNST